MNNLSQNGGSRWGRLLSALLLVLLAVVLIVPSAQACHRLDRDGNPKPHGKVKTCEPTDPPDPPTPTDTTGWFLGTYDHIRDSAPRFFVPAGLEAGSGDYVTADLISPIEINARRMSSYSTKGKSEICRTLALQEYEGTHLLVPESYTYGWTDDCSDGECAIEIRITFGGDGGMSEPEILALSGDKANRLDFVLYSNLVDENAETNPFLVERTLVVDKMVVDFIKPGTTRAVAICEYIPTGVPGPQLNSVPQ